MDPQAPYTSAPPPYQQQAKDPNTAFLIELVGGLFGLLGLGYFYVGRTNDGILRLILFLFYNLIVYAVIVFIATLTGGILGCVCGPIQIVIQVAVAYWSANGLKTDMLKAQSTFM